MPIPTLLDLPDGHTVFRAFFDAWEDGAEAIRTTRSLAEAYLATATDLYPDLDLAPVSEAGCIGIGDPDSLGWARLVAQDEGEVYLAIDGELARAAVILPDTADLVVLHVVSVLDPADNSEQFWDAIAAIRPSLVLSTTQSNRFQMAYAPLADGDPYRVLDLMMWILEPAGSPREEAKRRQAAYRMNPDLFLNAWGITGEVPLSDVQAQCDAAIASQTAGPPPVSSTATLRDSPLDRYAKAGQARAEMHGTRAPSRTALRFCQGLTYHANISEVERKRILGILKAGATHKQVGFLIGTLRRQMT